MQKKELIKSKARMKRAAKKFHVRRKRLEESSNASMRSESDEASFYEAAPYSTSKIIPAHEAVVEDDF